MNSFQIYCFLAYLGIAHGFVLFLDTPQVREKCLALLNLIFCLAILFVIENSFQWIPCLAMVGAVLASYGALRIHAFRFEHALSVWLPVLLLIGLRASRLQIMGVSFLCFRLSYLALEVSSEKVARPSLMSYLGYAFFPLLSFVGPITSFKRYSDSIQNPDWTKTPFRRCWERIFVGGVKFFILASAFRMLGFGNHWRFISHLGWSDFMLACIVSYLSLYLSFSGACDMIIGASGLLGISVDENFDYPLFSRNIQDFWNRFHITLARYLREVFYIPFVITFGRIFGSAHVHLISCVGLVVTFCMVGLWHGVSRSFLALGLMHGIAMGVFYLFSVWVKKLPESQRAFFQKPAIRVLSTLVTFLYVSLSSIFFENGWSDIRIILDRLIHQPY